MMKHNGLVWSACVVALGLAVAGWFVGHGFLEGRMGDRFVTVKGVSERDVIADIALWPIRFVSTDNDLGRAQTRIDESKNGVLAFLRKHGIEETQVEVQALEVNDLLANPYRSGPTDSRFIITQTLIVRSAKPTLIRTASQKVNELVDAGIVLSSSGGPTYLFTRLNALKPEMIAEATANARAAAAQFASDSGSSLGHIRRANQGVFVILARDRAQGIIAESQPNKTVRVVSTIDYYLKD